MSRFKMRSQAAEQMDDLELDEGRLALALADIRRVNRLLGGHATSLAGLRPFLSLEKAGPVHVLDVGCGDGEFLRYLAGHCRREEIPCRLTGWDFNPKTLDQARQASAGYPEIAFRQRDLRNQPKFPEGTLVICNLFLHHFTDTQIRELLAHWLSQGPRAIVVNDLHRNSVAYYLFWLFGLIFMRSPIARSDGRISILRGFRRKDFSRLAAGLPLGRTRLVWRWAFRYLWTLEPKKKLL